MQNILKINNIVGLLLICATATFMSCGSKEQKKVEEKQAYVIPDSLLKTLKFDTVRVGKAEDGLTLTGMVDFNQDNQVNVFPMVSGNIQDVKVQLGDYVTRGQTLAVIKSSEMAGYENNMIVAETNLTNTKKQLDATKDLFKSGLSSQLDVTNAQTNYDQAVAQLQMAQRVLKINGSNRQGEFVVKSPIDGFIVQKNITNNMAIRTDNGNNLFTISDLKNVWVQANVYESNINKIHMGDEVNVTTLSYPGKVFKGKVDKLMNVLDPTSKVMKVRVVLPNDDYALKPQMFASVTTMSKQDSSALTISSHALIFDHSEYYVLIYHGNGKADITPVVRQGAYGNDVFLSRGVKPGDVLIAYNALQIYNELNN